MNIKFVVIGLLIIGGLIFFNDRHYKSELEDQFRQAGQSAKVGTRVEVSSLSPYNDRAELLKNEYPHMTVSITLEDFGQSGIPDKVKDEIKQTVQKLACNNLTTGTKDDADLIKSRLNVLEEDGITWTYIVYNHQGEKFYEHTQVVKDCSEFMRLREIY